MPTELDANGLRAFLSGKEMVSATHARSNPSYQRFFVDGAWESMDFDIEIVRRKGHWAVQNDNQSPIKLCVTVTEQNGRKVVDILDKCYGISINKASMAGSIFPPDAGAAEVFVKFRDFVD